MNRLQQQMGVFVLDYKNQNMETVTEDEPCGKGK